MNTSTLLSTLLELSIKSSLLLLIVLAVSWPARRLSAAQQSLLWSVAFGGLLLLPLTKVISPWWRLPAVELASVKVVTLPAAEPTQTPATGRILAAPARTKWRSPQPPTLLLGAWLVGVVIVLGYRSLGSLQLALLRRRSQPVVRPDLEAHVACARADVGLTRPCPVLLSEAICVPCTFGILRPVVLFPIEAGAWDEERCLAALRHEFAHVVRHDYLARWLAHLTCALHWLNPLAWLAMRRLHAAQEAACDDLVLRAGTPPADYAALLVETARALVPSNPGLRAAVAMARPSTLEDRVLAIVDPERSRCPATFATATVASVFLGAVLAASALAQVAANPKAATAATTVAKPDAQVLIQARFLEAAAGTLTGLGFAPEGSPAQALSAQKVGELVGRLNSQRGLDLVSTPSVTTRHGQRAEMSIGHEVELPKGSEPPRKFVGIVLEVLPTVRQDKIELEAKINWTSEDEPRSEAEGKPFFHERKLATTVSIIDGAAVILRLGQLPHGRERLVIVQASLVALVAAPPVDLKGDHTRYENGLAYVDGHAALARLGIKMRADSLVYDHAQLHVTLSGKVEIESGNNLIEADQLEIWFMPDGSLSIHGAHQTRLRPTGTTQPTQTPGSASSATESAPQMPAAAESNVGIPFGIPVVGKPGFVTSPHAPTVGYIDVRGFPTGTQVKCPYTNLKFLVP